MKSLVKSVLAWSALLLGIVLAIALPVRAWHAKGHARTTLSAVKALPHDVPEFFRKGGKTIAHVAQDPDLFTRPIAPPSLHAAEAPEHFLDVELLAALAPATQPAPAGGADILGGIHFPPGRYEFIEACLQHKLKPGQVGLLPYAIVEHTHRLSIAFAEYRKWPDDPAIQQKCLVYAGILAHYAEDAVNPLHTTVDFDGRLRPDGTSPRSGIHNKVDALLGKVTANEPATQAVKLDVPASTQPAASASTQAATQPANARQIATDAELFALVIDQIKLSRALLDKVYELEPQVPAVDKPITLGSPVEKFAVDRLRAATTFTARLYLFAWRQSQNVQLPEWVQD